MKTLTAIYCRLSKEDGDKEECADYPANAAHAVEHAGERDEHQARAIGVYQTAACGHRRDDHEHRDQRGQRIEFF